MIGAGQHRDADEVHPSVLDPDQIGFRQARRLMWKPSRTSSTRARRMELEAVLGAREAIPFAREDDIFDQLFILLHGRDDLVAFRSFDLPVIGTLRD
jgi:hypothetical protein